jgi:hypothetical protein
MRLLGLALMAVALLSLGCGGRTTARSPARPSTVSAEPPPFEYLMGTNVFWAATDCGYGGLVTEEWAALQKLIDARDEVALEKLATSAKTSEGRVLGIIGLVRLGVIDRNTATERLEKIPGRVQSCDGCMLFDAPAAELIELSNARGASEFLTRAEFERQTQKQNELNRQRDADAERNE